MPRSKLTPGFASIARTMRVSEIMALLPECASLLQEYGLTCFSCSMNSLETLEEGCVSHGFPDQDIDTLVIELNDLLRNRPSRPQTLTLTKAGAEGLRDILVSQGQQGKVLEVDVDERGGFCMEVRDEVPESALVFTYREVPEVRIAALPIALSRIGGSTIDMREGRFKLDLPEDSQKACACAGGGTPLRQGSEGQACGCCQ